jgi:hypothetical protein
MTTQIQFNANEVKCNGTIGGAALVLNDTNKAKLTTFINMHFMMVDKKQLLQELEDSDMINMNWEIGTRANSTVHILNRMVSGLMSYALKQFGKNGGTYKAQREISEMWINAQVSKMTAKEIITIMEKALIDCATADYYYNYEKSFA